MGKPLKDIGLYRGDIMVTLKRSILGMVELSTYSRARGHQGSLCIDSTDFTRWMDKDEDGHTKGYYKIICLPDYALVRDMGDSLMFSAGFLDTAGVDILRGFQQSFVLDKAEWHKFISSGDKTHHSLHIFHPRPARIDVSHALPTLRRVLAVPRFRRAFSKAMRDCFRWPGDTVTLYPDGRLDFGFQTAMGMPEAGGLILHTTTLRLPSGEYSRHKYSVHT